MFEDFKVKLDFGKAIIICNEDLNLDSYRSEIRPKLMVLKSNTNKIYGLDHYEFTKEYKSELFRKAENQGYNIIDITEMIREKIKDIVEKEVQKYIEENIDNTDYITDFSVNEYPNHTEVSFNFLREANNFGKNLRDDKEAIKKLDISIRKINEGIIGLRSERYDSNSFEYDLEKQEFNIDNVEIMKRIYSRNQLRLILAYEQYKQDKTPPIYNEIAKINNFLEDKKSVTVELHNGTKIKAETYLSSILDIKANGDIFIADRYSNKIIEGNPIEYGKCLGTELKCLRYSKSILHIQSDAFRSLKVKPIIKKEELEDEEEL